MLVKRKTRKAIRKSVSKAIKKHGPKVAAGVAGSVASALATLASTTSPRGKGKSNLAALSQKFADALTAEGSGKRKKTGKLDGTHKAKREKKRAKAAEQLEESM